MPSPSSSDELDEPPAEAGSGIRISADIRSVESGSRGLDAHLSESREVLILATSFATNCGSAYKRASDKNRRLLNQAVVRGIEVRDGRIATVEYREPFDVLFGASKLEYRVLVEKTLSYSNLSELGGRLRALTSR